MRLLRADSLTFEEHFEPNVPQYAVLSHRWEEEEILYADIVARNYEHKKAFRKLQYTCIQATEDKLEYIWIDTFCIDKTSSADLSEAINSMFSWYRDSKICYAYLSDYEISTTETRSITSSGWFSRGWTLQELIAPCRVVFYDKFWTFAGKRSSLRHDINMITKIPAEVLERSGTPIQSILAKYPAGRKMSWAANRCTTRIEDSAYSLLGLFQVNMPLLYGEGPKAFVRLQKEILAVSADLSLLAWETKEFRYDIFARMPDEFGHCHDLEFSTDSDFRKFDNLTVSITNLRLQVENPRMYNDEKKGLGLSLECHSREQPTSMKVLRIYQVPPSRKADTPQRKSRPSDGLFVVESAVRGMSYRTEEVDILEISSVEQWPSLIITEATKLPTRTASTMRHSHVKLELSKEFSSGLEVVDLFPSNQWRYHDWLFTFPEELFVDTQHDMGAIAVKDRHGNRIAITFARCLICVPGSTSLYYRFFYEVQTHVPERFGRLDPLASKTGLELLESRLGWDQGVKSRLFIGPGPERLQISMEETRRGQSCVARLKVELQPGECDVKTQTNREECYT